MNKRKLSLVLISALLLLWVHIDAQSASALEWSSDDRLTTSLSFDISPSVIQTGDNKIWVVWQKEVQSTHSIFYKTSSDYGASWSIERNLTKFPRSDINVDPAIMQLSNGTIWVVWSAVKQPFVPPPEDFDLSASPSNLLIPPGGSNTSTITVTSIDYFSGPVDLNVSTIKPSPDFINATFDPPQVTPPPNYEANSTMTIDVDIGATPDNYTIVVRGTSETLNKTDSTTVKVEVTSSTSSSASAYDETRTSSTSSSELEQTYDIYYRYSHDSGASWSEEVRLVEDPADDLGPHIFQASNGTIWLVWSSNRMDNQEIFYKTSSDFGASWSDDIQLTYDSNKDLRPAITQMQDEKIWVIWHSDRYGDKNEILYKTYSGLSWSASTHTLPVDPELDNKFPTILQDANGTIWIFWSAFNTTSSNCQDVYYRQSLDNGENWSSNIKFTEDEANVDQTPAATQSVDSRIWVTWTSNRSDSGGNWDLYCRTSLVHNVAVTEITPSETKVYQKENITIDVAVQNYGDYDEMFTVACYANSTFLDAQVVTLDSRTTTSIDFIWNTSDFARGNYFIKANASRVDGEVYTGDNIRTHGTVRVKLLGDVDDNGVVEASDLSALSNAYGSLLGNPNGDEEADMNGDQEVNISDLFALAKNYGETE